MQISLFTTVVTLLLSSDVALAGTIADRQEAQCSYKKSNRGECIQGQNMFCTGVEDICASVGKKDIYNAFATKENEIACKDLGPYDTCWQTAQCC